MTSVDLRPAFENWGLDVRRQGERGTCSVFTMTAAVEYALAAAGRTSGRLSVEFLNWAANQAVGKTTDGGFFSDLWEGLLAHGLCCESDMPYEAMFDNTMRASEEAVRRAEAVRGAGLRLHWIKPWDPNQGVSDEQLAGIKRTLSMQYPVCGGFLWPKVDPKYPDGILEMPPREEMRDGHSVLLVGFRDDPAQPGGGLLIFNNTSKGHPGACMSYAYAKAYMNDAVWVECESSVSAKPSAEVIRNLLGPMMAAPAGRNRRVSSNEQPNWSDGNMDMTWLLPGESLEMPVLQGPGVITHMWFTSHSGWVGELNALSLRIFWDDQKDPGVEVPLADFFAVGQGKPAVVESVPVQVSPTGALSCYWRMPFRKSARIVITNDNPDRSTGLYWQVDWTQVEEVPAETPYFQACYRQEYPAVMGRDYMIAEITGRGQYVGTVMSLTLAQDGWFGEGDDFFYIDGEKVPSLQGTGSEDYFNDAWGFRPRTGHWFGQPRWQGDNAGDSGVCYRWHLLDAVNFTESLKVTIEHKGNWPDDMDGFFVERPDFISSVAFWYQQGEPRHFAKLPSWQERRVPWINRQLMRAFRFAKISGKAKVRVANSGLFGASPLLAWSGSAAGEGLTLPFELDEDGRYAVRLNAASGPDGGTYDVELDGRTSLQINLQSDQPAEADILLGTHVLKQGRHTISFRVADSARVGSLAVEMLRLLKLPPAAQRKIKSHNEAHFVRLGIGRAVYAYRLAYDRLPESLEMLVQSGFMSARYLNDHNNVPLRSRRDGDFLVVESVGPDTWTHRWQGLDARR